MPPTFRRDEPDDPKERDQRDRDRRRDDSDADERERSSDNDYRRDRFTTEDDDRAGRHWRMCQVFWKPTCNSLSACGCCSNE